MSTISATPAKLKSGEWGARVESAVKIGDKIKITTKGGKSWESAVTQVIWTEAGVSLVSTTSSRPEPTSFDGKKAIVDQHWSQRGRGSAVRLCAGGCGRRVGPRYAECFGCAQESLDAM